VADSPTLHDAAAGGELLGRVIGFGRYLRRLGMPVTLGQVMDTVRAIEAVGLSREYFRLAARTTLVTRRDDGALFDEAFDLYWRRSTFEDASPQSEDSFGHDQSSPAQTEAEQRSIPSPREFDAMDQKIREGGSDVKRPGRISDNEPQDDDEDHDVEMVPLYSSSELLRSKDFAEFTTDEEVQARRLMETITWETGMRRSRRTTSATKGVYLDPRRSLRSVLKSGEMVDIARRKPKLKPRKLVVICDISGSMDRYSRLLLQFLHTVRHGDNPVEVFVFSTRLTRITRQLRTRDIDGALSAVAREVHDWAGGTRIGECLRTFNTQWSRRVLRRGAVVLVISDGWDRGDPDLLQREMDRLQRASYRLIWLNPLLGSASYRPMTRGIQAALPYVDDFLPVHNLDSLESLARTLSNVSSRRPVRRQNTPPALAS